ncbi:hypothetical protein ACFL03_08415 [Thermodesulfobacteriota bacterium]
MIPYYLRHLRYQGLAVDDYGMTSAELKVEDSRLPPLMPWI